MHILAGTSGYSYKEWKGSFYPPELPASGMLRFYAGRFGTVEINNTFYRMPSAEVLSRWSEEVPEHFRFVLKAPRRITHEKRLKNADDPVRALLEASTVLGPKRGPLLFQLPPSFRADPSRLEEFLSLFPASVRVALEFRHPTWLAEEVYQVLERAGACLCISDREDDTEPPIEATTSWGYLRLRREDYPDELLRSWAERVRTQPWSEAFVFFKHEDEGKAPELARRFSRLLQG